MDIEQLLSTVNTGLLQGKSLTNISKELGYKDESTIRKRLNKNGYKRIDNQFIKPQTIDISAKNESNTKVLPKKNIEQDKSVTKGLPNKSSKNKSLAEVIPFKDLSNLPEIYDNLATLQHLEPIHDEIKLIKFQLDKFQAYIDEKENKCTLELREFNSHIISKTYKLYEVAAEEFKKFCSTNPQYKVQDLVSNALVEFIERHK